MPYRGRFTPDRWHARWENEFVHRPPTLGKRARLLIPLILSLAIQLPGSFITWEGDGRLGHMVRAHPSWLDLFIAVVGPLALLGARRYPGPVVAVVAAAASADLLVGDIGTSPPYVALGFAIVSAIVRGARVWAWISVAAAWVFTLTVGLLIGVEWAPARIAGTTFGILIVFGIAEAVRTRRENYNEFRRRSLQRKQTEVQAERVRIARELHDVLAHSLSQINVQAGVGLHLMEKQPAKAAEALASIKETSKTALDEVRSVLGVLRAEAGQDPSAPLVPEPDLARLVGLAASVTSQGVDVTLTNTLETAPQSVQLAIYRIVQESLTNVVRHAHATSATVTVGLDGHDYLVTVTDNGKGGVASTDGGGRGLLGMLERAELLGGSLITSKTPAGGFVVTARIPQKEAP
jgi:signal transduction histidine kinase